MDDFLGTSIQYSEQQILRLEREHAAEKERIVNELIENGFLDSDYESTSDYSTETDTEMNEAIEQQMQIENEHETEHKEECARALVSRSHASKFEIDEDEFIQNEAGMMELAEMENEMDSLASLLHLMEMVLDIKSFLIFIIMAIALPHCIERGSDIFGGFEYENDAQSVASSASHHGGHGHSHFIRKTVWVCSPSSSPRIQADDEERDGDEDDDIAYALNLDLMTMTLNTQTNKMFAELERHRFKIGPHDLLCNDPIGPRGIPSLHPVPPLLLSFGASFDFKANNVGMMRIFKETLSDPVGRHFLSSHGVLTLIMSFAGIAAFAASNSITAE